MYIDKISSGVHISSCQTWNGLNNLGCGHFISCTCNLIVNTKSNQPIMWQRLSAFIYIDMVRNLWPVLFSWCHAMLVFSLFSCTHMHTCITHFISSTLLVPGWTASAFRPSILVAEIQQGCCCCRPSASRWCALREAPLQTRTTLRTSAYLRSCCLTISSNKSDRSSLASDIIEKCCSLGIFSYLDHSL